MRHSTLLAPCAALALVLAAPLVAAPQAAVAPDVSARVDAARSALGWERLQAEGGAVRVRGKARFLGTDARQTMAFDGAGRFAQAWTGELEQRQGFDGERHWIEDWNRTLRVQHLGDAAQADMARLFLSGAWCAADAPLRFSAGATEDVLAFRHADGVLAGEVALDPGTGRPREVRFGPHSSRAHWTFDGWGEHDGLWFPSSLRLEQGGEVQGFELESLERIEATESVFALPARREDMARFDPGVPAALEVRRAPTGHLLVRGLVDGLDLGWFIFDSGAGTNCISNHVAKDRLDGPFGRIGARGVGGTVPSGFWRAQSLTVGPLTLAAPVFLGLDLGFLAQPFGVEVAGIVGYEFLAHCTVEFDARESTIAVHEPARYVLPEGARWERAVLYSRQPCVEAALEQHRGLFKIDTGAAGDTLTMHFDAVRDLELLEGRHTTPGHAGGVGGQVATREGPCARFELGGHVFEDLQVAFATEDLGAFADAYVLGNIGGKLLEPFVLVFDYPGERLGFVPRP
jgi:hypothetical protein